MEKINAYCRKIKEEDLEMIRHWRMLPEITRYMTTDPKISAADQKKWYDKICAQTDDRYWLLEVDGVPSGVVSLVNPDKRSRQIHTGVYIAVKEKRSLRLILDVQWNLYDYAFDVLGMNKVCEEVFTENRSVLRILDICGSKVEGTLRDHVFKNNVYYDMTLRGILKREWEEKKKTVSYNRIPFETQGGTDA